MDAVIKAWKTSRKIYRDFFDKYSFEQMNIVPDKFSNNIIWNIGHIIAAQQSLVYRTSNLPMNILTATNLVQNQKGSFRKTKRMK